MKLAIFDVNPQGQFEIHAADCADVEKQKKRTGLDYSVEEHDSLISVSKSIWHDQIAEGMTAEEGLSELDVKPCCKHLPVEQPADIDSATKEVINWAQAVLTALNVGDVKSESLLHLKLREVMIAYRAAKAKNTQSNIALTTLFESGKLVHVFAGLNSSLPIEPKEGELPLERIVRAHQESPDGSVWITPHWC